jgi:hypothetical protein
LPALPGTRTLRLGCCVGASSSAASLYRAGRRGARAFGLEGGNPVAGKPSMGHPTPSTGQGAAKRYLRGTGTQREAKQDNAGRPGGPASIWQTARARAGPDNSHKPPRLTLRCARPSLSLSAGSHLALSCPASRTASSLRLLLSLQKARQLRATLGVLAWSRGRDVQWKGGGARRAFARGERSDANWALVLQLSRVLSRVLSRARLPRGAKLRRIRECEQCCAIKSSSKTPSAS